MNAKELTGWRTGFVFGWVVAIGCVTLNAAETKVVEPPAAVQDITLPDGGSVQVKTAVKVEVQEKKSQPRGTRKTAVFVDNRAGDHLNQNVLRLEDQVVSQIGGASFEVISKEDTAKALNLYPEANRSKTFADLYDQARNTVGTQQDRDLADRTSALRLAQNLGADYLLLVAIDTFNSEVKRYKTADIDVKNTVYTLRGAYKLLDGVTGGAIGGAPVRASKTFRESANLSVDNTDVTAELVEKLATAVAQDLLKKADTFKEASVIGDIPVWFRCQARDLQGNEISLTDIGLTEDNRIVKGAVEQPLQVSALVEIDGMVMGSTPARINVKPGAHTVCLKRAGFDDAVMTVKAVDGMDLTVTMQMSADGFSRWQQIRNVLNGLDVSRKLTDAEVERIRGVAQMFRQSGYRIDQRNTSTSEVKSDVKVDAKSLPDLKIFKSIF